MASSSGRRHREPSDLYHKVLTAAEKLKSAFYEGLRDQSRAAITRNLNNMVHWRREVDGEHPDATAIHLPSWEVRRESPNPRLVISGDTETIDLDTIEFEDERSASDDAGEYSQNRSEAEPPVVAIPLPPHASVAHCDLLNISFGDLGKRTNKATRETNRETQVKTIHLPGQSPVPNYSAWVPVNREFWFGEDFFPEPHMPFFGDEEAERTKSFDVFAKMNNIWSAGNTNGEEREVSDGELDHNGRFVPPPDDDDEGWLAYGSLAQRRRRQSCRSVILEISRNYPLKARVEVADALAKVLDLPSRGHVMKHFQLALAEEDEALKTKSKLAKNNEKRSSMRKAQLVDIGYSHPVNESWCVDEASMPLKHFCFTCHVFNCRQHAGHNVEPIVPIKDLYVERRSADLKKIASASSGSTSQESTDTTTLKLCSEDCHLSSKWHHVPESPPVPGTPVSEEGDNVGVWTVEERLIVRETLPIFKCDPCNISKMVGSSKTCRQTHLYLESPEIAPIVRKIVSDATRKRWPLDCNRGGESVREVAERNAALGGIRLDKSRGKVKPKRRQTKAFSNKAGLDDASGVDLQEKDFAPCAHLGPCDRAACSCYVNNLKCEATCGCNTGRWTSRGFETPDRNGVHDKKKICSRRHLGCQCKPDTHCNTEKCACWLERRSCDPDFCYHCCANILPSQIDSRDRGCRNVGVLTGWHKRTLVGNSNIHGFGLFAGEIFEKGDLVGVYGGGIMDTDLAESVGFLYDAKDHTFFFDVTEKLVVDGGLLGMKTKFCNFVLKGSEQENTESRAVNVRGVPHIALIAKRRIEVGEEFLFDYLFGQVIPDWARRPDGEKYDFGPSAPVPVPVGPVREPVKCEVTAQADESGLANHVGLANRQVEEKEESEGPDEIVEFDEIEELWDPEDLSDEAGPTQGEQPRQSPKPQQNQQTLQPRQLNQPHRPQDSLFYQQPLRHHQTRPPFQHRQVQRPFQPQSQHPHRAQQPQQLQQHQRPQQHQQDQEYESHQSHEQHQQHPPQQQHSPHSPHQPHQPQHQQQQQPQQHALRPQQQLHPQQSQQHQHLPHNVQSLQTLHPEQSPRPQQPVQPVQHPQPLQPPQSLQPPQPEEGHSNHRTR